MDNTNDNLAGEGPTPVNNFLVSDSTRTYAIVANSFDEYKWPIGCIWLHGPELMQKTQWRELIDIGQVVKSRPRNAFDMLSNSSV